MKKTMPKRIWIALSLALLFGTLIGGAIVYVYGDAYEANTLYVEGGIYPSAPSYTMWNESSTYYAKNAYGHITYSGTNASQIVNTILSTFTGGYQGWWTGGEIYFKAGDYIFDTPILILKDNVILRGEGRATHLIRGGNNHIIQIGDSSLPEWRGSTVYNTRICDMQIDGFLNWEGGIDDPVSEPTVEKGLIYIYASTEGVYENLYVCLGYPAISIRMAVMCEFENIRMYGNKGGIHFVDGEQFNNGNDFDKLYIGQGQAYDAWYVGFQFLKGSGLAIRNSYFETNGIHVRIGYNGTDRFSNYEVCIENNVFDTSNNSHSSVYIGSTEASTISANSFNGGDMPQHGLYMWYPYYTEIFANRENAHTVSGLYIISGVGWEQTNNRWDNGATITGSPTFFKNTGTVTGGSPISVAHNLIGQADYVTLGVVGATTYETSWNNVNATHFNIYHSAGGSISVTWYAEYEP